MTLLTFGDAREALRRSAGGRADQLVAKTVLDSRSKALPSQRFDVFLSYSHMDQVVIAGVVEYLRQAGLEVYIDRIDDPSLDRTRVAPATANTVRTRMQQCRNLYYASTPNATHSRWMPWELGYFDGLRPGGVFILPVVPTSANGFPAGQEYLGLYPIVEKSPKVGARTMDIQVPGTRSWSEATAYARRTQI
jgi:hypothetical protein